MWRSLQELRCRSLSWPLVGSTTAFELIGISGEQFTPGANNATACDKVDGLDVYCTNDDLNDGHEPLSPSAAASSSPSAAASSSDEESADRLALEHFLMFDASSTRMGWFAHSGHVLHACRVRHLDLLASRVKVNTISSDRPTVFILTSGNAETEDQCLSCCSMFKELGFAPLVLDGVRKDQLPPKSCKIGQPSSYAWTVSFLPQIVRLTEKMKLSDFILVAEDSCWPTECLTRDRVRHVAKQFGSSWLGGVGKSKNYPHELLGKIIHVRARAGCKCFVGTRRFWNNAQLAMLKLPTSHSADSLFQILVALKQLHLYEPSLAGSMQHVSARLDMAIVPMSHGDLEGNLLVKRPPLSL